MGILPELFASAVIGQHRRGDVPLMPGHAGHPDTHKRDLATTLAMLKFQRRANATGDPTASKPYLDKLKDLHQSPATIRMSFDAKKHPRGQPDNAGKFVAKASLTKEEHGAALADFVKDFSKSSYTGGDSRITDPRGDTGKIHPDKLKTFLPKMMEAINAQHEQTGFGPSVDKLYERTGVPENLTPQEFRAALLHAHEKNHIRLTGWSKTAHDLPRPDVTPIVGPNILGYAHPGSVRLSWLASTSSTGHVMAIGKDVHEGRRLYGADAEAALRHQEAAAAPQAAGGAVPAAGEDERKARLAKLLEQQKSRDAASEFLERMTSKRHTTQDMWGFAAELPNLPPESIDKAEAVVEQAFEKEGGKHEEPAALMDQARKALDAEDAAPAHPLDRLAANHENPDIHDPEIADAINAAHRGEHGPDVKAAVERGSKWENHQGDLRKKHSAIGRELAAEKEPKPAPSEDVRAKAKERLASENLFHPSENALPKNHQHAHDNPESLMAAAKEAKPVFDEVLDTGKGVDKALGATAVHATSAAAYAAALEKDGPVVVIGGIKGLKRAREKVEADYGGDWSKLHDVVRGTVGVDSHEEIPGAIEAIRTELAAKGWSIVKKPKNKFEEPTNAGYRDINLTFTTPDGLTGEIQVNTKAMLKAKEHCHLLYEQQRDIEGKAKKEGRDLTPDEMKAYTALAEQQKHVYDTAWQVSLGLTHGSDLSSLLRDGRHSGAEAGGQQAAGENAPERGVGDVRGPGTVRDESPPSEPAGVRGTGAGLHQDAGDGSSVIAGPHIVGEKTTIDAAGFDEPIPAHFAVVDLAHLKPSHSYATGGPSPREGYPAGLQPRNYAAGSAEDLKVRDIARKMQVRYHLADVPDASNGSPTVTQDGTVLNGNARAMSLELAKHQGRFGEYKSELAKKAGQFGIDPTKLAAMEHPVLVRVVNMDPHGPEAKKFAAAGNVSATQGQSPVRTAASLAKVIDQDLLNSLKLDEDTTFSEAVSHPASGKAFRQHLANLLPAAEKPRYFTPDGQLTEGGTELVRSMLLSKVLPVELIEKMGEHHKGLKRTIEASIPQLLKVRRDHPEADLTPDLVEALQFKATHPEATTAGSIENILSQGSLFGGKAAELSPGGRMLVDFLNENGDKPRVARQKFTNFLNDLSAKGGLFGGELPDVPTMAAESLGVEKREGATFGGGGAKSSPELHNAREKARANGNAPGYSPEQMAAGHKSLEWLQSSPNHGVNSPERAEDRGKDAYFNHSWLSSAVKNHGTKDHHEAGRLVKAAYEAKHGSAPAAPVSSFKGTASVAPDGSPKFDVPTDYKDFGKIADKLTSDEAKALFDRYAPEANTAGGSARKAYQALHAAMLKGKPAGNAPAGQATPAAPPTPVDSTYDKLAADMGTKLVPIHAIRAAMDKQYGNTPFGRMQFDAEMLKLRKPGSGYKLISISDKGSATPEQLQNGVKDVGEHFFYLEKTGTANDVPPEAQPKKPGFTGTTTDSLGRTYHWVDGVRVAGPPEPAADEHAFPEPPAVPPKKFHSYDREKGTWTERPDAVAVDLPNAPGHAFFAYTGMDGHQKIVEQRSGAIVATGPDLATATASAKEKVAKYGPEAFEKQINSFENAHKAPRPVDNGKNSGIITNTEASHGNPNVDGAGAAGGAGGVSGERLGAHAEGGAPAVEPGLGEVAGGGVPSLPEGEGVPSGGDVQRDDRPGDAAGDGSGTRKKRSPRKRRPEGGPPRDDEGRRLGGGIDGSEPAIPNPTPSEQVLAEEPTPENPTDLSAGNFRYTDRNFIVGGLKTKFAANMAAIRTLREIQAENRTTATGEEQAILSKFTGWGQFPGVFNDLYDTEWKKHLADHGLSASEFEIERGKWSKERDALQAMLTPDEWEAAKKSTLNAHYTHPDIVDTHWKLAQKLGFKGGKYLETSAGIGYYLGLMPPDLAGKTRSSAVELDPTPGNMLKLLYPQCDTQVQGFQKHLSPDGWYDLIASNVPFGKAGVNDPDYNKFNAPIHDYFFLKSADKVRPGGLVMHITSTGTLDKGDSRIREELAKTCDLVGAIRFPGGAHKENAGTEVVTDMIVLRKRLPGEEPGDQSWLKTTTVPDPAGGEPIPVNQYFADHPEQMLGTLDRTGTMYGGKQKNVSLTPDYDQRLKDAIDRMPANVMSSNRAPKKRFEPETLPAPGEVKVGGFHVQDGKLFVREGGGIVQQDFPPATVKKIAAHLTLRDAYRAVINAETAGEDAEPARADLNKIYDKFVAEHGFANDKKNRSVFGSDPDGPAVLSLEDWDPKTKKATKSAIFSKITVGAVPRVDKANNVAEGLGVSLHESGGLDIDRVAELTGLHRDEVGKQLVTQGLAYQDPSEGWQPADHYLSSNVRRKLALARAASATDPAFHANVAALEKVQPEDIHHDDIEGRLGSPWIPPEDVKAFVAKMLGARPEGLNVDHDQYEGWKGEFVANHYGQTAANSHAAQKIWGHERFNFMDVLNAACNNKLPTFTKAIEGTNPVQRENDKEANDAMMGKVQELKDEFKSWLWTDDERRERLHRHYNDNFNNIVNIKYNGQHQKFPGMNPEIREKLHPHIKNFVWQTVTTGRGLAAHEVGTGKTYAMIASAMELRRLGLARKPALLCKKANVDAITKDAMSLYPGARILSTADMFTPDKRKQTIARIATGDYDMVIMTHDHMDMTGMKPETEQRFIRSELAELTAAHQAAFDKAGKNAKNNRVVKNLEDAKAKLEAKLEASLKAEAKDDAVYFEDLGIDHLFVDEAARYKTLPVYSKMGQLKGIPNGRSQRATSMLMRTQWLAEKNKGRGTTFLTGTPISNTMAELYTMQRFIQPEQLKERGLDTFDAWANCFTDIETKQERDVKGEYKNVTRLSKFTNMPELMQISKQMMDVQRADDLTRPLTAEEAATPVPPEAQPPAEAEGKYTGVTTAEDGTRFAWKNGERQAFIVKRPKKAIAVHKSPKSEGIQRMMKDLVKRADDLKNQRGGPGKGEDNMLAITTDGRKGSIDLRMLYSDAKDEPDSKTNRLVDNVLKIQRENAGKTQMIFSDVGSHPMEKTGFHLFGDIIDKLVKGGIPRDKIVDFTDLTDAKREAAIDGLRDGTISVALGGTEKLGTGVNAQQKLLALHHIDCPWRPADLEQREGRAYRHGNGNKKVFINNYVAEGSLDEMLWQGIDRKQRFVGQIMHAKDGHLQRSYTEEDTEEMTPEQIMAAASGDPRILEKVQLHEDVRSLENAQKRHDRDQYSYGSLLKAADNKAAGLHKEIENYRATQSHLAGRPDFHLQVGGKTFTERGGARERFLASKGHTAKSFGELPEDKQKALDDELGATRHEWDPAAALEKAQAEAKPYQTKIATYRGLPIHHENGWAQLETANGRKVNTGTSLRAIENKANAMGDLAEESERALDQHHKDVAAVREKAGKAFPHTAKLAAKKERLKHLEAEMSQEGKDKAAAKEKESSDWAERVAAEMRGLAEEEGQDGFAQRLAELNNGTGGNEEPSMPATHTHEQAAASIENILRRFRGGNIPKADVDEALAPLKGLKAAELLKVAKAVNADATLTEKSPAKKIRDQLTDMVRRVWKTSDNVNHGDLHPDDIKKDKHLNRLGDLYARSARATDEQIDAVMNSFAGESVPVLKSLANEVGVLGKVKGMSSAGILAEIRKAITDRRGMAQRSEQ